jgi:hypothetical protein
MTIIMGHRGAPVDEPENTLRSFSRALAVGVAAVELDVQLTKDGRLAVIHDETLDRTTSGRGLVKDFTLAELQRLDAGRGEPIPSLEEVFDLVQGQAHLVVELKQAEAAGALRVFFQNRRAFASATVISGTRPSKPSRRPSRALTPASSWWDAPRTPRAWPGPPALTPSSSSTPTSPRNWWPPRTSRILRSWSGILTIQKS